MDDVLQHVLDQLSQDTRTLLDSEARRLDEMRGAWSEYAGYDPDAPLCAGHDHDHDD